jgi:hypothetical protein
MKCSAEICNHAKAQAPQNVTSKVQQVAIQAAKNTDVAASCGYKKYLTITLLLSELQRIEYPCLSSETIG